MSRSEATRREQKLPTSTSARLEALFRAGEDLWYQWDHLREAHPVLRSPEYWYWLMWHGIETPEVADHVYPFPDAALVDRVVGRVTPRDFKQSGLVNWRRFESCFREAGFEFDGGKKILDYGCGCARVLRFFGWYADSCRFYGADVDQAAMEWCSAHIDFASFVTLNHEPPSPYEAETFDGLYAYSVFTHLPEARLRAWLEDLHRICKPGAILVITIHGQKIVDSVLSGERDMLRPTADELRGSLGQLEQDGFAFFPYREMPTDNDATRDHFKEWDLEAYGNTFITEAYLHDSWTDLFEVVALHRAPDDWQDYVVLKRH